MPSYSPTPTPEGSPPPDAEDAAKASNEAEASSAPDANNSEVNQNLAELFAQLPEGILAPKAFEPEHDIATGCQLIRIFFDCKSFMFSLLWEMFGMYIVNYFVRFRSCQRYHAKFELPKPIILLRKRSPMWCPHWMVDGKLQPKL